MTIVNFTPYSALFGGALIGLSAALLYLFKGRIAGISGIFGGILVPTKSDLSWRVVFILGIVIGGFIWHLITGDGTTIKAAVSPTWIIIGGIIVGVGTTLGSGCTSGHGICGLSRFSLRSLFATLSFMATGFISVFIIRHLLG
ncbi:YeeE/YedE family protein [Marinicellulosiphila megalodicopiae]|uniref:YeeE/YedE family protein n=1 Tax=Marinicellulosiphila megalodicopiae TaxID=2724896 RepID=UPI003BAEA029